MSVRALKSARFKVAYRSNQSVEINALLVRRPPEVVVCRHRTYQFFGDGHAVLGREPSGALVPVPALVQISSSRGTVLGGKMRLGKFAIVSGE